MKLLQQRDRRGIQQLAAPGWAEPRWAANLSRRDAERRTAIVERILAFDLRGLAVFHLYVRRRQHNLAIGDLNLRGIQLHELTARASLRKFHGSAGERQLPLHPAWLE